MDLDFDKYCVVDGSPTTVLPAPRHRSKGCRKSNGKVKCENELLNHHSKGFTEIGFNRYRSASCRDVQSRKIVQEGDALLKRGSVYQSSKEVRLQRRPNDVERKKIEFSRGSASTFSFLIDSLCSLDEESSSAERNRSELSASSSCRNQEVLHSRDPLNHSFYPIPETTASPSTSSSCKRKRQVANSQSRVVTSSYRSTVAKTNDNDSSQEGDVVGSLHKSLSAKLALPHSPAQSDSDGSKASSPTARLHPVLNMLDPFVKSKSHRNSLHCAKETGCEPIVEHIGANCTSLLNNNPQFDEKDNQGSHPMSSPAHLHGLLKVERKHGVLSFEFSVKSPEDVYVAKTCKVDKPLTWAYTFHSLNRRRKSNATTWGFKENNKEPSVVGQMLVSRYLCTDLKASGAFSDSMVTEFVLYDVAHSRRSISSQDSSCCSPDVSKPPLLSDETISCGDGGKTKNRGQSKHPCDSCGYDSSSHPVAAVALHPEQEIAAIIMQVPFEKRERLKFQSGDRQIDKPPMNLLDLCHLEQEHGGDTNAASPGKLHVVIPAGNHSLPSSESHGPSPLLERWRLGGGCDCGGWDMACALNVCANPHLQMVEGRPLIDSQHPAELFVEGRKEKAAAFRMRGMEEGRYAVDFHAELSCVQAFSMCVAMLYGGEEMLERKHLISSEEEKVKPSFVVNPPFSPIGRV